MSTTTKVLILLLILVSVSAASITATLYAQRVDWHDKFMKEVNQHQYSIMVLRAEAEAREIQVRNLENVLATRDDKIDGLQAELESKLAIYELLRRQLTDLSAKFEKTLENTAALNRNLTHMIAMQEELRDQNKHMRQERDTAKHGRQVAEAELYEIRGRLEVVMRDLNTAETEYVKAARQLERLQAIVAQIRGRRNGIE